VVLNYAADNQAVRVVGIRLQAGELRDIEEEWLQRYFDYLSKDTLAAEARITLTRIPLELQCTACSNRFSADIRQENQVCCPVCGGTENRLVRGNEFLIDCIEVI
jgi:hydrogenase nickel incorporation protein HypA/HybF